MKIKKVFLPLLCFMACTNNDQLQKSEEKYIRQIKDVLFNETKWIKVHAAEYLLWLDSEQDVRKLLLEEEIKFGNEIPYRIGIWRVLAQSAKTKQEKNKWIKKIADAFFDVEGSDRIYAAETLAKLGVSPL